MKHKHPYVNKQSPISQESAAKHWTLTDNDKRELDQYRKEYRLFIAIQLCTVRLWGRFLLNTNALSTHIINYLTKQLDLAPTLAVHSPTRKATLTEQRQNILTYLGFKKYDSDAEMQLTTWVDDQARKGKLPQELIPLAEQLLLDSHIVLPGQTVIERKVIAVCNTVHAKLFETIYQKLTPELRKEISALLDTSEPQQRSYFHALKEYPPSARVKSIKTYLHRYQILCTIDLSVFDANFIDQSFLAYLYKLTKHYNARDVKRFDKYKRYALIVSFLIESRKVILDHLAHMHDQYMMELCRKCKNAHEKKHREFRKRHKKAVDVILNMTDALLNLPENRSFIRQDLFNPVEENTLRQSVEDMRLFKRIEERGYSDLLLARYPNFRKYFSEFIQLPFQAQKGSQYLMDAIELIRKLDTDGINALPQDAPTQFVPRELRIALKGKDGNINRNAWEMGLALSIRDKLRSGDLYLPESKQHASFWNLIMSDLQWQESKPQSFDELEMPQKSEVKSFLIDQYMTSVQKVVKCWGIDDFATIHCGKLKLKRDDKLIPSLAVIDLQKAIEANLPTIRIEKLLMEVDQLTQFTQQFKPLQGHSSRPQNFYKTLMAAIISQATNLGIMATSASVQGVSVDMLRQAMHTYIFEETITAANAVIVNHHHRHPLSASQGAGEISSSDLQRYKMRADCLLATPYPRYFGYYEKAIGIYTHVSNQLSVYSTQAISCGPREALYVLDGLLENNTILKIKAHTTDTHGFTEILFALCFLLGFYFMPRIRDLKDQQLYRVTKEARYGEIDTLLTKTVDIDIVEEQWETMMRVAVSLKKRTTPAHVVMQRLTSSGPSDRLTKAFINLGRIVKTEYILRYLTDSELRRTVQSQLNKGEYRHRLPRWIFFAEQGEFTTSDYEEIMNKASCLSLVSNAILMWNTVKIDNIIKRLEAQGETITQETLSHVSLLPFKHVLPNGT